MNTKMKPIIITTRPRPREFQGVRTVRRFLAAVGLACCLGSFAAQLSAEVLFRFDFNEGAGGTVTSTNLNLTGQLGFLTDPTSYPFASDNSPSGLAADKSLTVVDPTGYLLADSTNAPALADVTLPITAEAWILIPEGATPRNEGIVGYGGSWKLGLRADGQLAFTMFGVVDVDSGLFPAQGVWTHVAAEWEPTVGVTYFIDGVSSAFIAETNALRAPNYTYLGVGSAGIGEPVNALVDRVRVHRALLAAADLDSVALAAKAPLASTAVSFGFNETAPPYTSTGTLHLTTKAAQDVLLADQSPKFTTNSPSGKPGDTALSFDGNDTLYVDDPNQVVNLVSGDFTIQAWVQYTNLPGARSIIFSSFGPGGAVSMSVTSDRKVFMTTYGILDIPSAASIPNDPLWHHIAVIHRKGVDMRFYVDGVLGDTIPYTSGLAVRSNTQFNFGGEFGNGLAFRGSVDRIQLSNEALLAKDLDFLAIPGVIPGAPELEIGTAVQVAWPVSASGFVLQSTTDLTEPKVWTNITAASTVVGDKLYTLLPATTVKTFYRLVRPVSE